MGWGIRGQYGHETGAMIAGLLVSLVIVAMSGAGLAVRQAAIAVAWGTVGISFGGSMTYGQTVGLTHDAPLVGNWDALRWGMLGLSIKGGLWIGFGGLFLGMGMGGVSYRAREMALLMAALIGAYFLGIRLINSPFDPAHRILPAIYFSDDWRWEPDAALKPRPEVWGGMLLALTLAAVWTRVVRRDVLAFRLMGWGILGGAVGFPAGQCLQAFHAWSPELFKSGLWARWDPVINWWNMMETTFGAITGACLALGAMLNRSRIRNADAFPAPPAGLEWVALAVHVTLLAIFEFSKVGWVDRVYDIGLVLGTLPVIGIATGRWWPGWLMFPITLLPIAGKTLNQLSYEGTFVSRPVGWMLLLVVPMAVALRAAGLPHRCETAGLDAGVFARRGLLVAVWTYWGLNFAFFHLPWPWQAWTVRTPNAILFTLAAVALTLFAARRPTSSRRGSS